MSANLDKSRVQHLLNRIEQVLNFFPVSTPNLHYSDTVSPAFQYLNMNSLKNGINNDANTKRNDGRSDEKVFESDALLSFKEGAFDAALIR